MSFSTVVLVLTDLEGSTRLWAAHPDSMNEVMARHHQIVHAAVSAHGGRRPVDQGEGDAVLAAFESVSAALSATIEFQRALEAEPWPAGIRVRDRVGLHVGEVTVRDGNLFGSTVNRAARLRSLGAGGQVLLSASAFEVVRDQLPEAFSLRDLGEYRMKDLARPEHVYQLVGPGLLIEFPPLAGREGGDHNLPIHLSEFLGRDGEITELHVLLRRKRLVTITGFGGMGKTRLALQVAAEHVGGFADGVWFVDLSQTGDASQVPSIIGAELGLQNAGADALVTVTEWLRDRRVLLVLDNLEQLLPAAAGTIGRIITAAAGVQVLATSREPLRLEGEQVFALEPLPVPPVDPGAADLALDVLPAYAAVALFLSRAVAARHDFELSDTNAAAVAGICVRLEGIPLALELAAARLRVLSPAALLQRLERTLPVLTGGNADSPERQRTLRATIAWSYEALEPDQQRLLNRLSVFPGTFSTAAAEHVAAAAPQVEVWENLPSLVERSLVRYVPSSGDDDDRYRLLLPIQEYAAEELLRSGEQEAIRDGHAQYFAKVASLPDDWSFEDELSGIEAIGTELHNMLAAVWRLHDTGQHVAEVRLVERIGSALTTSGQVGRARELLDHATEHAAVLDGTLELAQLLLERVRVEWNAGQMGAAKERADEALVAARAVPDVSLHILALSGVSSFQSDVGRARALVREAEQLLERLPARGTAVPSWLVRRYWLTASLVANYFTADQQIAALRSLVDGGTGAARMADQFDLAATLFELGRLSEAESALADYTTQVRSASDHRTGLVNNPVYPDYLSAMIALGLGNADAATDSIRAMRATLQGSAMPEWATGQTQLLEAAVARIQGRAADAEALLEPLGSHEVQDVRMPARWLRSVLYREAGRPEQALNLLKQCWNAMPRTVFDEGFVQQVLLERAVQTQGTDPVGAARLLALTMRSGRRYVPTYGVTYDVEAMLGSVRRRLGDDVVDMVLAEAAGEAISIEPDWIEQQYGEQARASSRSRPPEPDRGPQALVEAPSERPGPS